MKNGSNRLFGEEQLNMFIKMLIDKSNLPKDSHIVSKKDCSRDNPFGNTMGYLYTGKEEEEEEAVSFNFEGSITDRMQMISEVVKEQERLLGVSKEEFGKKII